MLLAACWKFMMIEFSYSVLALRAGEKFNLISLSCGKVYLIVTSMERRAGRDENQFS
jgi:hypothetical protein